LTVAIKDLPEVDAFHNSPPCKSYSKAGANRGDEDDKNGGLWKYAMKFIILKTPAVWTSEQVPNICTQHKRVWQSMLKSAKRIGGGRYDVMHFEMNAPDLGDAQSRTRVFMIGVDKRLLLDNSPMESLVDLPPKNFARRRGNTYLESLLTRHGAPGPRQLPKSDLHISNLLASLKAILAKGNNPMNSV